MDSTNDESSVVSCKTRCHDDTSNNWSYITSNKVGYELHIYVECNIWRNELHNAIDNALNADIHIGKQPREKQSDFGQTIEKLQVDFIVN